MSATYETRGAIAIITMDNPPVNGLAYDLRVAIVDGIDQAAKNPAISAIVLTGKGNAFSGGADIREFNSPKVTAEPNLVSVIRAVEDSEKPVIAAINGICMGGGFELALGCHFRVATANASIALPEIKLGLIPGAGGTQRLPRLIGLEAALNLCVSGNPVVASRFKGTPLFDVLVEGDALEAALDLAAKIIAEKTPIRKVRDLRVKHANPQAFVQFARNMVRGLAGPYPAPMRCIDAVANSLTMKYDEGQAAESAIFRELMMGPVSRAMRHAFVAERAASKIPDVPESTPVRTIKSVAVIGAGTMGGGISMNFLNAGIPVIILEMKQEALDRGLATIAKNYEATVKKGRLKPEDMQKRLALLTSTLSYDDIAQADLVIEAVFEDIGVKEAVFTKLDQVMKHDAILASNTSTLDVDAIAAFTKRPQSVVGLHFFSPANVMKLLEVVRGKETGKDVMATVMKLAKTIKKTAVVSGVCDGFIGNRMLEQYLRQAMFLLDEGASPQQVDKALEKFGMAMGPFRMSDMAGLDIGWAIRKRKYKETPNAIYSHIADRVCELGRFGQKTGAGFYAYKPGKRDALPDPIIEKLIADYRTEKGITPRAISDEEIVQRCIYALTNEGAHILEEGIAQRASDIDIVYLTGYGFPYYRGGPMAYADQIGLANVVRSMNKFAQNPHADPGFWQPAQALRKLAADGKSFS